MQVHSTVYQTLTMLTRHKGGVVPPEYRVATSCRKESATAVERAIARSSLVEVIDCILDKGIVIDAWVRISLVGIELLAIGARVVIAGVETFLKCAEAVGLVPEEAASARLADADPFGGPTRRECEISPRRAGFWQNVT